MTPGLEAATAAFFESIGYGYALGLAFVVLLVFIKERG